MGRKIPTRGWQYFNERKDKRWVEGLKHGQIGRQKAKWRTKDKTWIKILLGNLHQYCMKIIATCKNDFFCPTFIAVTPLHSVKCISWLFLSEVYSVACELCGEMFFQWDLEGVAEWLVILLTKCCVRVVGHSSSFWALRYLLLQGRDCPLLVLKLASNGSLLIVIANSKSLGGIFTLFHNINLNILTVRRLPE